MSNARLNLDNARQSRPSEGAEVISETKVEGGGSRREKNKMSYPMTTSGVR